METTMEVYATASCGDRAVHAAWVTPFGEVWLVEQRDPAEPAPAHARLARSECTLQWDGRSFWVYPRQGRASLASMLRGRHPLPETGLTLVRELGEALPVLAGQGIHIGDFYEAIVWAGDHFAIDFPGALLQAADAGIPAARGQDAVTAMTITLAAVLHSLYTGKCAVDPPYVFLPPSRFGGVPSGLDGLVRDGVSGTVGLSHFLERLRMMEAEGRLIQLLPPPKLAGAMEPGAGSVSGKAPSRLGQNLQDWLLWLVCMGAGILILAKYS